MKPDTQTSASKRGVLSGVSQASPTPGSVQRLHLSALVFNRTVTLRESWIAFQAWKRRFSSVREQRPHTGAARTYRSRIGGCHARLANRREDLRCAGRSTAAASVQSDRLRREHRSGRRRTHCEGGSSSFPTEMTLRRSGRRLLVDRRSRCRNGAGLQLLRF